MNILKRFLPSRSEFPSVQQLKHGVLLCSIAQAVINAGCPELAYEISWNQGNYNVNNGQGDRATVTFKDNLVVGAVFDHESKFSRFGRNRKNYDINIFLRGMPDTLREIAETETLRYLLDKYKGRVMSIITTAFWSSGDRLTAAMDWETVYKNGGHVLRIELLPFEAAMPQIAEYFDLLNPTQLDLVSSLFQKRIAASDRIILDKAEYTILTSGGVDGIQQSKSLFAAIGISFDSN